MTLNDTIEGMTSPDYKERFKAEYQQLQIRYWGLDSFIKGIEYAERKRIEPPKHDCPLELLYEQRQLMSQYLVVLMKRTKYENISLN